MTLLQALLAAYGTSAQKARYKLERDKAEAAMQQVLEEQTAVLVPQEVK